MAGLCDDPVISTVCNAAGDAADSIAAAPFNWVADGVGSVAQWLFEGMWSLSMDTTSVNVNEPGLLQVYDIVFGIAIFVMVGFFLLQLITGMIQRDPAALSRAGLGLAKSVLGSFIVVTITATLLTIVDELSTGIIQATGNTVAGMGAKLAVFSLTIGAVGATAPGAGALLTIFLGCLMIAGCAILWFSLLIRKALILLATVMAPIALAGMSWDTTRGWIGKWASFMLALIISKFVVVVIFLIAITQVDSPITLDIGSIANPIAGIALLFMAAFAPYLVYKVIAFIGFDTYHAMSMEQEAKQAMNRPLPVPNMPDAASVKKVLGGDSGKGSAQPGGDGPPPQPSGPDSGAGARTGSGAEAGASGGGAGASTSASTGAGGGGAAAGAGAAAAGPAAGAVIAAQMVKAAATAGPKLGAQVGGAADAQAGSASGSSTPSIPQQPSTPAVPPSPPSATNSGATAQPPSTG